MDNTNQPVASTKVEKKNFKHHLKQNKHLVIWVGLIVITLAVCAGLVYFKTVSDKIYIDKANITADKIDLTATAPGLLQQVMVNEGDQVPANTVVAQVGNELIKTDVAGTIIAVQKNIGALYNPGQPIVSMVQTSNLRVVGQLDEDKGLKDVAIGQTALFKVDAFGGQNRPENIPHRPRILRPVGAE